MVYKLQLPNSFCIHAVFHVSLLKKHNGDPYAQSQQLPLDSTDNGSIIQPAVIVVSKPNMDDSTAQKLVLVQWEVLPIADTSWEDLSKLQKNYPKVYLEDKVSFHGRNDTLATKDTELSREDNLPNMKTENKEMKKL